MSQFRTLVRQLKLYFSAYGGWNAILTSPLFHLSLLTTALGYNNWLHGTWIDQAITLVPSLLGFSLGTYAILFSLITTRLKRALKAVKNQRGVSYLDEINATFFHFILVQVVTLFWAFLYSGSSLTDLMVVLHERVFWAESAYHLLAAIGSFVGMLLLVYSIALAVGAALAVYRLARIFDPGQD